MDQHRQNVVSIAEGSHIILVRRNNRLYGPAIHKKRHILLVLQLITEEIQIQLLPCFILLTLSENRIPFINYDHKGYFIISEKSVHTVNQIIGIILHIRIFLRQIIQYPACQFIDRFTDFLAAFNKIIN